MSKSTVTLHSSSPPSTSADSESVGLRHAAAEMRPGNMRLHPISLKIVPIGIAILAGAFFLYFWDDISWKSASYQDNAASYESYIKSRADGRHTVEAKMRLDEHRWASAKEKNSVREYERYIQLQSDGKHIAEAQDAIEALEYREAIRTDFLPILHGFIEKHKTGPFVDNAKEKVWLVRLRDGTAVRNHGVFDAGILNVKTVASDKWIRWYDYYPSRSQAQELSTAHLGEGGILEWSFATRENKAYAISIRYSNVGEADTIAVFVDQVLAGKCKTERDNTGAEGWNRFRACGPIGIAFLSPGEHTLRLIVENSDEYGVEVDYVRLDVDDSGATTESLRLQSAIALPENGRLEGEDGELTGNSPSPYRQRSNASGKETVHLTKGGILHWYFVSNETNSYSIRLRYSNDGASDTIALFLGPDLVGEYRTDAVNEGFGQGWDEFLGSGMVGTVSLPQGPHMLALEVRDSDSHGVELDYVEIAPAQKSAVGKRVRAAPGKSQQQKGKAEGGDSQ